MPSPVRPADHRFNVGALQAQKMADAGRPAAASPGRGAIPVTPAAGSDVPLRRP